MSNWGFTSEEYQLAIGKISNRKHLIVEGKADKCFFEILLDEFSQIPDQKTSKYKTLSNDVDVDTIETLIQDDNLCQSLISGIAGNRKKIECIHKNTQDMPKYNNLVFFIDREFDNFTICIDREIKDELNKHKVDGSLIWSRGHSIENYFFDSTVLRQPLRGLSDMEFFEEAIQIFENRFFLILRLASAISITLKECQKITDLEAIIDCEMINLDISSINLKLDELQKKICEIKRLSIEESQEIIDTYKKWYNKIEEDNVNIDTLRWICHGHIGIKIILQVYYSCINYCATKVHRKIPKNKQKEIWQNFANWWATRAVRNECCYPEEVLERLLST